MRGGERGWGNPSYRTIGAVWVGGVLLLGALMLSAPGLSWWGATLVGLVTAALAGAGWEVYGRSDLEAVGDRLVVTNPFRTIEVPLAAIAAVEAGQHLSLRLRDGREVRVWSVQAANAALMLGQRSRVDQVADEVRQLVATHGGDPAVEVVDRRWDARPMAWMVAAVALAVGLLRGFG